jgi:hypothetical protein
MKRLPPPTGNCTESSRKLDYFAYYSEHACDVICWTKFYAKQCNCILPHMPQLDGKCIMEVVSCRNLSKSPGSRDWPVGHDIGLHDKNEIPPLPLYFRNIQSTVQEKEHCLYFFVVYRILPGGQAVNRIGPARCPKCTNWKNVRIRPIAPIVTKRACLTDGQNDGPTDRQTDGRRRITI